MAITFISKIDLFNFRKYNFKFAILNKTGYFEFIKYIYLSSKTYTYTFRGSIKMLKNFPWKTRNCVEQLN